MGYAPHSGRGIFLYLRQEMKTAAPSRSAVRWALRYVTLSLVLITTCQIGCDMHAELPLGLKKATRGRAMSLTPVNLRLKRPAEPAAPAAARECKPRVAAPPSEELAAANALRGLFAAAPPAPAPTAASAQSKRVLSMVPPRPAAHPSPRPSLSHSHPLRPHTTPFSAPRPLARRPSSSPRTTS